MGTKFTQEFKSTMTEKNVRPHQLPKASPNLNRRCERFVRTIKSECLSKFIIFGRRHLDYLLAEITDYHKGTLSSMVKENLPPVREIPEEVETLKLDQVVVRRRVGSLISSFERKAA